MSNPLSQHQNGVSFLFFFHVTLKFISHCFSFVSENPQSQLQSLHLRQIRSSCDILPGTWMIAGHTMTSSVQQESRSSVLILSLLLCFRSGYEVLAWASVQIICQCTVCESRVQLPRENVLSAEEASTTGCDTSFVPNKGDA